MSQLLAHISLCEEQILELGLEIRVQRKDYEELLERLDEIHGVRLRIAELLVAEWAPIPVGLGMRRMRSRAQGFTMTGEIQRSWLNA
jgi:hypothetical protein